MFTIGGGLSSSGYGGKALLLSPPAPAFPLRGIFGGNGGAICLGGDGGITRSLGLRYSPELIMVILSWSAAVPYSDGVGALMTNRSSLDVLVTDVEDEENGDTVPPAIAEPDAVGDALWRP